MTLIAIKHKNNNPNQTTMVLQTPEDEGKTKNTYMVPWSECVPLIDKIKDLTGWSQAQILVETGYASEGNINKWVASDEASKRFKMALLGVLYELKYTLEPSFTHQELSDLFMMAMGNTIPDQYRRKALTKIAMEMSKLD